MSDPCSLVSRDLLIEFDVDVEGEQTSFDSGNVCRWENGGPLGIGLGIAVENDGDPLADVYFQEKAEAIEIGGFPAVLLLGEVLCDVHVKTASSAGFSVAYGVADGRQVDSCGGARAVAEHIAARVRRG